MIVMWVLIAIAAMVLLLAGSSTRIITQYERGVVLRFGQLRAATRGPGLALIVPAVNRLQKVNMQVVTMPVPAPGRHHPRQRTVRVDAVVYYRVLDPVNVVVDVQNYQHAIGQVAQASLRSIIGKSDLDDLLSNRERLNQGLELMLDTPALDWGVQIDRVEIKDVALPETMKRSMSRQAEAERERRSRVITAEGDFKPRRNWPRPLKRWPGTPPRCNYACSKPSSKSPPRRTPPSCCPSPSNCSASWNRQHPPTPAHRQLPPTRRPPRED